MSAARLLPWPVHEGIEYLAGFFLVLAPFVFGFRDEGSAFPVFVAVGVLVLVVALVSRGPAGVVDILPARVHAALDYILAIFLIVAPFLFGFTEVDEALTICIFLGLAHLVVSLLTAYPRESAPEAVTGT